MNFRKAILTFSTVISLATITFPVSAYAINSDLSADRNIIESGNYGKNGDNIKWTLDDMGTAVVSGSGEMADSQTSQCAFKSASKIIIEDGITSIGSLALCGCYKVESIEIPDSVKHIGDLGFSYNSLKTLPLPDSIEKIGVGAFGHSLELEEINIPKNLDKIERGVFYNCGKLTEIVIPDKVTTIESEAFASCENIISVTFPATLKKIEKDAFAEDISISQIFYNGTSSDWNNIVIESGNQSILNRAVYYNNDSESGDANCDRKISVADITAILQYINSSDKSDMSEQGKLNADINGDNIISDSDSTAVRKYLARGCNKLIYN